jgi:acyl-CoA thioester hydrolase
MAATEFETYRGMAYPWLCDSMGHMNTQHYAAMYDTAGFHFLSQVMPYVELSKSGLGWADVRQLIEYKQEVRSGTLVVIRSHLTRLGGKSIGYVHEMRGAETGILHSTSEMVTVLFDLEKRAAATLTDAIRARGREMGVEG